MSEDEIKYIVNVEAAKAQKEIYRLEQETKKLRSENKARLSQMISLEAAGKKETETYKNIHKQYTEVNKKIKENVTAIGEQTSKLNVLDMTMAQLKKQQKLLQRELDNTSKSLNPEAYGVLEQKLQEVSARMTQLKQDTKSFSDIINSDETIGVAFGNVFTKAAEFAGQQLGKIKDMVTEAAKEGMEMAEQADGVVKAFDAMNKPDLLDNLRKATKGTVNDVQLMTAAVQAKDFRIPLEDLGKYLQFAQLKAQQTGQSVDYMTNSIVTGLGRKSPMILDNLGISAAEISEKTKETGDFMKAVASIVDNQLAEAGDTYISAADRAAQATARWENAQRELGEQCLPLKESFDETFGEIKLGIINLVTWLVKNRTEVAAVVAAYISFKTVQLAVMNAEKIHVLITQAHIAVQKAWNVVTATGNSLLKIAQAAYYLLTGRITLAKTAMVALNTTMKANIFGVVAAAVAFLAYKLYDAYKAAHQMADQQKILNDVQKASAQYYSEEIMKLEQLRKVVKDNTRSLGERNDAIKAIQKVVPSYIATIDEEGNAYERNADKLTDYINKLKQKALIEGAKDVLKELGRKQAEAEAELLQAQEKLEKAKKEQKKANDAPRDRTVQAVQGIDVAGAVRNVKAYDAVKEAEKVVAEATRKVNRLKSDASAIGKRFGAEIYTNDTATSGGAVGGAGGGTTHTGTTHTGTTHTGTIDTTNKPNPDDIAQKAFSENRQADIDAANADYQQDVNNWNMALARKQTTQEKYDIAMQALKTQHTARILAIETSYSEQSQNINIKDAEKKKSLQESQQKNLQAAEQKHFDQQVEAENAYQDALAKVMEQGETKQQLTLDEELEQKKQILKGYYEAALQLAQENGSDVFQLQKAYLDAQEQIQKEYHEKELAEQKEADEKKKQARQSLGFDQQSEYDQQLAQLKQALDNQYITQEEYEKKVQQLKKDSFMKQAQYYTNLFSNAVTSLQNAEMANVDAKYDAEIKAAEGNTELQEKLEKKKANEKLKIQKKYADVNFAMQVAQIISNTATSIMKAYSDMGPIAGSVAAALMGVTGAAQLAVANAERQKVKRMTLSSTGSSSSSTGTRVASGRESGGMIDSNGQSAHGSHIDVQREQDGKRFNAEYAPGKRGYIDKPTVIVGEGPMGKSKEWVASNAALENPTVAPLIGILDAAQRAGNIRTFDMSKYLMAMQGRALGGSIDEAAGQDLRRTNSVTSPYQLRDSAKFADFAANPANLAANKAMEEMISLLRSLRDNGIPAAVSLTELEQKQQIREQSRKFAKK